MKSLKTKQAGFAHIQLIAGVIVLVIVSFAGGYVYNTQQNRQEAARQAESAAKAEQEKQLEAKQSASSEQKEAVDVPAEEKSETPVAVTETKPAETTAKPPTQTKTEPKPTTKTTPTYTTISIPSTSASVGAESVTLTANLPASYSGICKAQLKLADGSNAYAQEAQFGPASTCSVTVPRSKLTGGTNWKFMMYIKANEGTVKGESASNSFSL